MRSLLLLLTLLLSSAVQVIALYDSTPAVQTYESPTDFRNKVLRTEGITLVQFYAPWCGHCKQFEEVYSKIANMFNGIVNLGALDASSDGPPKRIAQEYNVNGFPTMKLFYSDSKGKHVIDVQSRDPNELIKIIFSTLQEVVQERADAAAQPRTTFKPAEGFKKPDGSTSSTGSGSDSSDSSSGSSKQKTPKSKSSEVLKLTSQNFSENVYQNTNVIAVAFIAPWCGHCKSLLPEWEIAASKLSKAGVSLATVDATTEEALAAKFQVQGFPTIKLFPGGIKKGPGDAMAYEGGREAEQIVQTLLKEVDRSGVPKEMEELISQGMLEDSCSPGEGQNVLCVLVALPHILETGAEGRNNYKEIVDKASKSVRGMGFEFMWFEGGNYQTKTEEALELTFGFPAIAAYSMDRGVYAVHRGSFTEQNVRKFLMGITTGKVATYKIMSVPKVVTVEPWDGKDGVPFEEEPFEWDDDDSYEDGAGDGDGDEF